jgi:hypothetical protein
VVGVILLELVDIVAKTAGNVHNKGCVGRGVGTGEQGLFNRVKLGVVPRQAALSVATHVVVGLRAQADGPEIFETVGQVGVVGRMHGRVGRINGIPPVGLAKELVELDRGATNSTKPG